MLIAKFHKNRRSGSWKEKNPKVFYHILALQPSWSCDQHYVDEFILACSYKHTLKFGGKWPSGF